MGSEERRNRPHSACAFLEAGLVAHLEHESEGEGNHTEIVLFWMGKGEARVPRAQKEIFAVLLTRNLSPL